MLPSRINPAVFENRTTRPAYVNVEAKGPMLDRVYTMRYKSYSDKDYIEKSVSEKFMDEFDGAPNCRSYLTYQGKKPIGSIRSCLYDPDVDLEIPVMDVFRDELMTEVGRDKTMIEANKFVVDPLFQRRGGVKARYSIYSNIADELVSHRADYLVAGIRTEHIGFYSKLFFKAASDIREYPHLNFKTLLVVCEDVDKFCDKIYSKAGNGRNENDALLSYSNC